MGLLLNSKHCVIVIDNTHLSIFIESSETAKYRGGAWVVISRTGTPLYPVENLECYLLWADIEEKSDVHIFGTLSACKTGYKIRKCIKVISYTNLSRGGRVMRWHWVKLSMPGRPSKGKDLLRLRMRMGVVWIFFLPSIISYFLPLSGRRSDID